MREAFEGNEGEIDLTKPYVFADWRGASGWHAPENNLRWTKGRAVIPLPAGRYAINLVNPLPIEKPVILTGVGEASFVLAPGGKKTAEIECVNGLAIEASPTQINSAIPGSDDSRIVGIAAKAVWRITHAA